MAEWSKALASGASPQGRGFEPHSCQPFLHTEFQKLALGNCGISLWSQGWVRMLDREATLAIAPPPHTHTHPHPMRHHWRKGNQQCVCVCGHGRLLIHPYQDSLAEWFKVLAQGASPQGCGPQLSISCMSELCSHEL